MPTEMLGPGTEAALELLVELETVLEDGGWDPFKEGEGMVRFWGKFFFHKNSWLTSWWLFSQNPSGKI